MSPEQCRGISSEIDQRTDVYALGIILYEMLTGAPPFLSEGFGDVLLMHLTQAPRRPREIEPNIPPSLEETVLRALEKDPERRLVSMQEFSRELAGPAARTTLREAGDRAIDDPAYAATDVLPRLRPSSTSARRTTLSSTASQLLPDTERMSQVRRRRVAIGTVIGSAVVAAGLVALAMRGGSPEAVSLDRPAAAKLSAGAAHRPAPAADPVPPSPAVVPPAEPPPVEPAAADPAPAASPTPPAAASPRAVAGNKPARERPKRGVGARGPARLPASEFAPLPDVPAALSTGSSGAGVVPAGVVPAGAVSPSSPSSPAGPPDSGRGTPGKPRLSTDKW
jgi:serine/threonine-protein kinase